MSRHRNVRSMNYEEDFYDDDDEYSRSVEDNYCISPSTAAQFTWNQDRERKFNFAAYMQDEEVIDEEEEEEESLSRHDSLSDSATRARLSLSEVDQARLNSCLEEVRNILGESVSESVMIEVIIENKFNLESSLNKLLSQQDAPKPQRVPRQRRNHAQDDFENNDLDYLLYEIKGIESTTNTPFLPYSGTTVARFRSEELIEADNDKSGSLSRVEESSERDCVLNEKSFDTRNERDRAEFSNAPQSKISAVKDSVPKISLSDLIKQSKEGVNCPPPQKPHQAEPKSNTKYSSECLAMPGKPQATAEGSNPQSTIPTRSSLKQCQDGGGVQIGSGSLGNVNASQQTAASKTHSNVSLSQLAKSHDSRSGKTPITKPSSSVISQEVDQGMASLSALVAQHSSQKSSVLPHPHPSLPSTVHSTVNTQTAGGGKLKDNSSQQASQGGSSLLAQLAQQHSHSVTSGSSGKISLSELASGAKSSPKVTPAPTKNVLQQTGKANSPSVSSKHSGVDVSLFELAKAHSERERSTSEGNSSATVSLSRLAQRHQSAGNAPSSSVLGSLTNLLQRQKISNDAPLQSFVSKADGVHDALNKLHLKDGSGQTANLSLSSCLKDKQAEKAKKQGNAPRSNSFLPSQGQLEECEKTDSADILPELLITSVAVSVDSSLLQKPSGLGIALCGIKRKRKRNTLENGGTPTIKYPRFSCREQVVSRVMYAEPKLKKIAAFRFLDPSPDDVINMKQKQAFQRSDKEFEIVN